MENNVLQELRLIALLVASVTMSITGMLEKQNWLGLQLV